MIRLERNILDQANTQLRALEDHVLDQDGGYQATMISGQLKALFSLAKLHDSGMSDECAGMLEEIERRSNILVSRLPESS
ncbi:MULTISPECIES: hypothetical protein [Salinicola]|jgi:hypothetical protein|uniref:hypothetical protein n=1 Tax=Salinicola TaxID=404432 RepID=UPI0008DD0845|nr:MULTISPECIES: hypothetical protein [Salinicola]MDF3918938.1 hypothetical protein [Salinicola salarius]MEC8916491.1 hypothetical protein [Pseudomonadota bacterium]OHZ01336.1 hypothetical protein BC443_13080 [Salinicola sp. MIT1003]